MLQCLLSRCKISKVSIKKVTGFHICDTLRDLLPFVQFEKREKHPRRNVSLSKVAGLTKSSSPPWVFFTFLNCSNDTKLRKVSHVR